MGRPALTDEEKKAKGTFDPRYSAEARSERAGSVVVAFPTLQDVPPCRFPLTPGGAGQATYDQLIRTLHEQKRLTVLLHMEVEMLAAGLDNIHARMAQGKNVPASAFTNILARIDKLQRADHDRAYQGSQTEPQRNKFARNGFAARR